MSGGRDMRTGLLELASGLSHLSGVFDDMTDPANPDREPEPSRLTLLYRLTTSLDKASRDLELLAALYERGEGARQA